MKKLSLIFGVLCVLALAASEENVNSDASTQRRVPFATKRLVQIAKVGSTSEVMKYVTSAAGKSGSVNDQLEAGFSCAVDTKDSLAAWNLALAYHKRQEDWRYNAKSFGWAVAGFAAGCATAYVCNKFLPQPHVQSKPPKK
ncbi:MAG: hypothetical protein M1114_04670 [Candidatus Dependentiae bacterium]|nr:hypothetical protein [Candidatus Dependentiae bacterium]